MSRRKKTTEEFIEEAKLIKPEYDYSKVVYTGSQNKVILICDKGHEFEMIPTSLLSGTGCRQCSIDLNTKKQTKTTEQFIEEAKIIHPYYNYSKVNYVNSRTKVTVICTKHGEFKITPNNLLQGTGCMQCGIDLNTKKKRKTTEQFIEEAKLIKPEYDYSKVVYTGNRIKVILICDKGHEFEIRPNSFLRGTGCAKCSSSKGENAIREYFNQNNIEVVEQKRFKDCKDKKPLPFDFYIPSINLAIEYDGEQHFQPSYFGRIKGKSKEEVIRLSNNNLKKIKRRDAIKTQYCIDKKIPLLRIPYTEIADIEKILSQLF